MLFALVKLAWRMMNLMRELKILGSLMRSLLHHLSIEQLFSSGGIPRKHGKAKGEAVKSMNLQVTSEENTVRSLKNVME